MSPLPLHVRMERAAAEDAAEAETEAEAEAQRAAVAEQEVSLAAAEAQAAEVGGGMFAGEAELLAAAEAKVAGGFVDGETLSRPRTADADGCAFHRGASNSVCLSSWSPCLPFIVAPHAKPVLYLSDRSALTPLVRGVPGTMVTITTRTTRGSPWARLAVGETVILLAPPSPPLLKHLLKGEGGAAE